MLALPEAGQLRNVLGYAEGRVWVPTGGSFAPIKHAAKLLQEQRGFYSYAKLRTDAPGIRIYAGWRGLPVVLDPNAVLVYRTAALAGVP